MAKAAARNQRHPQGCRGAGQHRSRRVPASARRSTLVKRTKDDPPDITKRSRLQQLNKHSIESICILTGIFEQKYRIRKIWRERRPAQ